MQCPGFLLSALPRRGYFAKTGCIPGPLLALSSELLLMIQLVFEDLIALAVQSTSSNQKNQRENFVLGSGGVVPPKQLREK